MVYKKKNGGKSPSLEEYRLNMNSEEYTVPYIKPNQVIAC